MTDLVATQEEKIQIPTTENSKVLLLSICQYPTTGEREELNGIVGADFFTVLKENGTEPLIYKDPLGNRGVYVPFGPRCIEMNFSKEREVDSSPLRYKTALQFMFTEDLLRAAKGETDGTTLLTTDKSYGIEDTQTFKTFLIEMVRAVNKDVVIYLTGSDEKRTRVYEWIFRNNPDITNVVILGRRRSNNPRR